MFISAPFKSKYFEGIGFTLASCDGIYTDSYLKQRIDTLLLYALTFVLLGWIMESIIYASTLGLSYILFSRLATHRCNSQFSHAPTQHGIRNTVKCISQVHENKKKFLEFA